VTRGTRPKKPSSSRGFAREARGARGTRGSWGSWGSWGLKTENCARKLMGIVDGSLTREMSEDEDEWVDKDAACQSMIVSAIDIKLMRRLMTCRSANQMWRKLITIHEQNATENLQLLQQKFYELRMQPNSDVIDHISAVEQMANQLCDLGEPISERAVMTKIICTLPPKFRHLSAAWDSVPPNQQTIESLTLRLLKEESLNRMQGEMEEEGDRAFLASRGSSSGSGKKNLSPEEKKKRAERISELKKKTRCNKCGKRGHWANECPDGKKESKPEKSERSAAAQKGDEKSEANTVSSDDHDDDSSAFMAYVGHGSENSLEDAWYLDGGATDHMTDKLEWFSNFTEIPKGRWPVMIADNRKLWARGFGDIRVECLTDWGRETRTIRKVLYVPELRKNLFSVGQAADRGFITTYTKHTCYLTSQGEHGRHVLTGVRTNKLYKLQLKVEQPKSQAHAVVTEREADNQRAVRYEPGRHVTLWHQRYGHVHNAMIIHMDNHQTVKGMQLASHELPSSPCEGCVLGKNSRRCFPKRSITPKADKPGKFFHSDVCGPMSEDSYGGARYFVLFKDDCSGYRVVYCIKNKSEVFERFKALQSLVLKETGNKIEKLRSDRGGEYVSGEFTRYLEDAGIRHEMTCPYTPEQNGSAERENRTLVECVRSMLCGKKLNLKLWGEAVQTAAYLLNRAASQTRDYKTPYELWTGEKPVVSHLRVFGCVAYAHVPKPQRKKLDPKSQKTILVGYCLESKGAYRLWESQKRRVIISRDVIFDELALPREPQAQSISGLFHQYMDITSGQRANCPTSDEGTDCEPLQPEMEDGSCDENEANSNQDDQVHVEPTPTFRSPRPQRLRIAPAKFQDYYVPYSFASVATSVSIPADPESYVATMQSPEANEWRAAMQCEYDSLMQNETWRPVPLPKGRQAVKCKWIYRVKTHSDGTVARYKARLVAQGCTQTYGVDYEQTFSPVVRHESIRVVLALAAQQDMQIVQFDVCTAFLHSKIDTEIYMKQPLGFVEKGSHDKVCLILKSLYGFKQSGRLWNKTFDGYLIEFDLHPIEADPCLYVNNNKPIMIVTLFVDDGLACCASSARLEEFMLHMEKRFAITRLAADLYVGMHIKRDYGRRMIYVDQSLYLQRLLKKFDLDGCVPVSTPADPNVRFDRTTQPIENPPFSYMSAVGSLMFAQTLSRLDISFAVNTVAQFGSDPQQQHYQGVIRIFRYLAGTLNLALCYDGNVDKNLLEAYADADYAGDILDRKSRTGSLLLINRAPVGWCSRKQSCVATSTTESEYIAASSTVKDVIWLRRLLANLGFPQQQPTRLFSDNQSAIWLVHNPEFHRRTKHIDILYHFIREHQQLMNIDVTYVSTVHQLADLFTKAFPVDRFQLLRTNLELVPLPSLEPSDSTTSVG
jgi:transposase InsO family protein